MSESLYAAMRAYVDVAVELQVRKVMETRSAPEPKIIEGPPGPKGDPGENGKDSAVPGPKGDPGELGKPGVRGADGIATREELHSLIEERMADINVRSFADVYQGVYEPDRLYTRGLATTWGGSLWLALVDTKAKPGENADWRLIVKKGADGRK